MKSKRDQVRKVGSIYSITYSFNKHLVLLIICRSYAKQLGALYLVINSEHDDLECQTGEFGINAEGKKEPLKVVE